MNVHESIQINLKEFVEEEAKKKIIRFYEDDDEEEEEEEDVYRSDEV